MAEINASESICKNCNYTFTKQYCNGCGQKNAERITVSHLAHDVMHAILHADKGIFPYLRKLVLRPGILAREYVAGKRKTFNPMQFLMLSIGAVILLMTFTHFYEKVELLQAQNMPANAPAMQEKLKGYDTFIKKNSNVIVFFLLPIFALFGFLLFNKHKNNYAEHLMLSVFAMSLSNVFSAIMLISFHFLGLGVLPTLVVTLFITIVSFFLTYKQFYQVSWFYAMWKSLAIYLLTMIVYMILSTVVVFGILIFG